MLRTFDLFDTLIARRCISPIVIYQNVEHASAMPGLADVRSKAGHQLWLSKVPHNTEDIYRLAIKHLANKRLDATSLAQLEYECEFRNAIPVLRAMKLIDRESVIVSDMHHPHWVIERLYAQASQTLSLRWLPGIYLSNQSKHTGEFWQSLRSKGLVAHHLGDNSHSDIQQAVAHGHQATFFDWTQMNTTELSLARCGLHSVARAVRSVRLRCVPNEQDEASVVLNTMCTHVVPVLALASVLLREVMRQQSKNLLVFVGRDGAVWQSIFTAMFSQTPTRRLPLSRRLMQDSPATASAMIQSHVGRDAIVVDLVGSGTSWSQLAARAELKFSFPILHLIRYPTSGSTQSLPLHSLIDWSQNSVKGMHALEAFCEESYASACDAQWVDVNQHAGFLRIQKSSADDCSICSSSVAEQLQNVIQCASHELGFEMTRANDQSQTSNVHSLLLRLLLELNLSFDVIDSQTNFWARNASSGMGRVL
jgi:hypothetical protein